MPVVLRAGGFTLHIYHPPREHPPPHVHVRRGGRAEVVIRLGTNLHPPAVIRQQRMTGPDIVRAMRIVLEHQAMLDAKWRKLHEKVDPD